MRLRQALLQSTSAFLIASVCAAQTAVAANAPTQAPAPASSQTPAGASGTITVPQGTSIPLTLVSTIKSKSTKPGDTVRATVAFPVTVGSQQAIPAGAYVEGVVNAVTLKAPKTGLPTVQIHFTQLVFANGYSVPLDGVNTEAELAPPQMPPAAGFVGEPVAELADASLGAPYLGEHFAFAAQTTTPTLPPLPSNGPSPAALAGIGIGSMVGFVVLFVALGHHSNKNADYLLFDNGWQFQMVLQAPLTLDSAKIASASN